MILAKTPDISRYKQHLDRAAANLNKQLMRAGIEIPVPEIVPTELEKGYRSRVKFKIYHRKEDVRFMGTDPGRGEVPAREVFWMLPVWARPAVGKICRELEKVSGAFPVHGLEIQLAHGREEIHVTLAVKRGSAGAYAELAENLLNRSRKIIGVAIPSKRMVLGGVRLTHHIAEMDIGSDYRAFFQSNIQLTPRWLEKIRSWTTSTQATRIVDLYCGVGLLAFVAADKAVTILGLESHPLAVKSARENAGDLGFRNARFIRSAAETIDAEKEVGPGDLVILDPPRTGCPPSLIASLAARRPLEVISVSCSPESHVRDLCRWLLEGYRLHSIRAYDAFPFTPFLETLAHLKLSSRCQS